MRKLPNMNLSKTPIESLKILLQWSNEQIIFGEMISSLGEERKKQVSTEIERRINNEKTNPKTTG